MCFNWKNISDGAGAKDELALEDVVKVAKSMRPLPQLLLSGGEPFIRKDVVEIVHAFYKHAVTRQVTIPTNGLLTGKVAEDTERMAGLCPEAHFNINVSLDGIGADHDISRGTPGCFEKLSETFHKLEAIRDGHANMAVNFTTILKKSNIGKAREIAGYVRDNFRADFHKIGFIRGDLREDITQEKDITLCEVEDVIDHVYPHYTEGKGNRLQMRVASGINRLVKKVAFESVEQKKRCFRCLAGKKMLVLTQDGKLMPCEPLWLEPAARLNRDLSEFVMADLHEYDFDVPRALGSPGARRVIDFIGEKKCYCQYGCAIYNSIIYSPSMYPRVVGEIVRGRRNRL